MIDPPAHGDLVIHYIKQVHRYRALLGKCCAFLAAEATDDQPVLKALAKEIYEALL